MKLTKAQQRVITSMQTLAGRTDRAAFVSSWTGFGCGDPTALYVAGPAIRKLVEAGYVELVGYRQARLTTAGRDWSAA